VPAPPLSGKERGGGDAGGLSVVVARQRALLMAPPLLPGARAHGAMPRQRELEEAGVQLALRVSLLTSRAADACRLV